MLESDFDLEKKIALMNAPALTLFCSLSTVILKETMLIKLW